MSWQAASFLVLGAVLVVGFAWYERSRPSARVLALVAVLAALATVGRIAFAPIPNVKPTTDIAVFAGFALGPVPGFAVGAVAALASNVFFGQGPFTPWQMVAWGMTGVLGGLTAKLFGRELGRWWLAAVCAIASAFFGAFMDVYQWTTGAEQDLPHYLAVSATSLPYNLAHVIGSIGFCLLLGPSFVNALRRYRRRFEVRWAGPAATGCLALALALAGGTAALAPARADASTVSRAVAYVTAAQNSDGGFGGLPGASSTQLITGWTALGLAAAGHNPADVTKGGNSIIDYVRSNGSSLTDTGDIERTILVLRSAGVSARSFAGRDLVAELLRRRSRKGAWDSTNHTAFGVLALRAAGIGAGSSTGWLIAHQNSDGGYGFQPGASSDVDDTGAAIEALAAGGRRNSPATRRAVAYLRRQQSPDGGFGQMSGSESNAQSTAWAVQGLVAAGRNPASLKRRGHTPLGFIASLQSASGSIRYSSQSSQTPVWVTAQAIDALERKSFPLTPAPRRSRAAGRPGAAAPSGTPAATGNAKRHSKRQGSPAPKTSTTAVQPPSATAAKPAPVTASRRASARDAKRGGGMGWSAWLAIGIVAGVAVLASWRILRGGQRVVPPPPPAP